MIARSTGLGYGTIAKALQIPKSTVYSIVRRIASLDPEKGLVNLPVNALKPNDICKTEHIPSGENLYCARCDRHGLDGHWKLARNPADEPKREPKLPEPEPEKPTRKQRRSQMKRP